MTARYDALSRARSRRAGWSGSGSSQRATRLFGASAVGCWCGRYRPNRDRRNRRLHLLEHGLRAHRLNRQLLLPLVGLFTLALRRFGCPEEVSEGALTHAGAISGHRKPPLQVRGTWKRHRPPAQ